MLMVSVFTLSLCTPPHPLSPSFPPSPSSLEMNFWHIFLQHVLEHGKLHERTAIIKKLTGQIVQMSQQKFASNVIEKCLTFGTPIERQTLVNEMLGSTDENEPLQVWQTAMCMLVLNLKCVQDFVGLFYKVVCNIIFLFLL